MSLPLDNVECLMMISFSFQRFVRQELVRIRYGCVCRRRCERSGRPRSSINWSSSPAWMSWSIGIIKCTRTFWFWTNRRTSLVVTNRCLCFNRTFAPDGLICTFNRATELILNRLVPGIIATIERLMVAIPIVSDARVVMKCSSELPQLSTLTFPKWG